jgi:cytochrome c oxidase subunit II
VKPRVFIRRLKLTATAGVLCPLAATASPSTSSTSIFSTLSTPASLQNEIAFFVLGICAAIFLAVCTLLIYALVKFRARRTDTFEPPQIYGSTQIELSWTIIPILIVTVLFLGTARVLFSIQDAPKPANALDVTAVGHQFWWEYRYPQYNVTAANELHIPLGQGTSSRATFFKLTSADVIHSFWIPQLGGKTDMFPNRVNQMWLDPVQTGLFVGQCAQFCGVEHAKMLLRVSVDTPEEFQAWIANQQRTQPTLEARKAAATTSEEIAAATGQRVFEQQACINCHTVAGTVATGRFGPDLTHLMSRSTLAAGIMANTPENLKAWITNPDQFKPGCPMPAMHLTDEQYAQITAYLLTLK